MISFVRFAYINIYEKIKETWENNNRNRIGIIPVISFIIFAYNSNIYEYLWILSTLLL
jgi:hypothetical protein